MHNDTRAQLTRMGEHLDIMIRAWHCVRSARTEQAFINLRFEQAAAWDQLAHETRARFAMAREYPITAERHRAQARRLLGGAA